MGIILNYSYKIILICTNFNTIVKRIISKIHLDEYFFLHEKIYWLIKSSLITYKLMDKSLL